MSTQRISTVAAEESEFEIDAFELLWEQHKTKILWGALATGVIVVLVFAGLLITSIRKSAAESAFASAKTAAEYRAVIDQYRSSPVAGDAALLLAKSLRDEKKYDEANEVLNGFAQAQPDHPFAALAKAAAAENLMLAGKVDDAVQAFSALAQSDAKSFVAPYALMVAAEIRTAQGQREAALRIYRELQSSFPGSVAAQASAPAAQGIQALLALPAPATESISAPVK